MFLYSEKVIFYEYNEERNIAKKYLEIENSGKDSIEDV